MGDGIVLLLFAGAIVSFAAVIAFVRTSSARKKPKQSSLFDLNR